MLEDINLHSSNKAYLNQLNLANKYPFWFTSRLFLIVISNLFDFLRGKANEPSLRQTFFNRKDIRLPQAKAILFPILFKNLLLQCSHAL